MSGIHPLSAAILANKRKGGKCYGVFDDCFQKIFEICIKKLIENYGINSISRVPPRPDEDDRFARITKEIAKKLDIEDVSEQLFCVEDFTSQKNLSSADRVENVKGKFDTSGSLFGKTIVLIDDIVSTGSTLTECVNQLRKAGAEVLALVLAINQLGNYWTADLPGVKCRNCSEKMRLQIRSRDRKFFYSCPSCHKREVKSPTISFPQGKKYWINGVNREIDKYQGVAENDGI